MYDLKDMLKKSVSIDDIKDYLEKNELFDIIKEDMSIEHIKYIIDYCKT